MSFIGAKYLHEHTGNEVIYFQQCLSSACLSVNLFFFKVSLTVYLSQVSACVSLPIVRNNLIITYINIFFSLDMDLVPDLDLGV